LAGELNRAPTEKEVDACVEQEKDDLEKAVKVKGVAQPKRKEHEVTYSGVLGDPKAGPWIQDEKESEKESDPLMLPWSVVQNAKAALKQNPDLASELFKEAQAKAAEARAKKRKSVPGSSGADGSDDESSGSSSDDNPDNVPKSRLSCCNARDCGNDNLLWSQFLLVDSEDADWQGYLWGTCQPCSKLDKKTFKKLARQRKEHRAEYLRGRRQRARMINLLNAQKVIAEMFPGASQKIKRELAIARTMALASAGCRIFDRMSNVAKIASDMNCQRYLAMIGEAAEDPSMACPIDARTLTATESSYLTNIAAGWSFSFICRMPKCMFYGMNDAMTWVPEITQWGLSDYHFRCPRCGEQYSPGTTKKGEVAASFCMSITDPTTGVVEHVPCAWPPSPNLEWINNQIEIHARDMKTEADLDGWLNRTKLDIKKLIQEQSVPGYFDKLPVGENCIWRCEESGKWHLAPIKERGYVMGRHFTDVEAARQPYNNWNELIGIFASHLRANREMALRKW